jgi:hypothetical protein
MMPVFYAFSRNVALIVVSSLLAALTGAAIGFAANADGSMPSIADGHKGLLLAVVSTGSFLLCVGSFFVSARIAERRVL